MYRKKGSIIAACKVVRVDRNTIALNAPIAELSIAAPERFAAFKDQPTRQHKLGEFAGILPIQLQRSRKMENRCLLARRITTFSRAIDVDVC